MKNHRLWAAALLLAVSMPCALLAQGDVERVLPSVVDPRVTHFDFPDVIYNGGAGTRGAPLVVFLPGTNGGANGGPALLLDTVAKQGYRVIFLPYDDDPAVAQVCPRRPPPCSARFREARVFGGDGPVSNPPAEAIVTRLAALLHYLDRKHPDAGWGGYIAGDGGPAWPRIVVSGLSQGAGMAAYIAKQFPVRRVVLFSSPWDAFGPQELPAPWLATASATPPWRWWAERHARENTTRLIAQAYGVLGIPPEHLLVFDGGLPPSASGQNPYHGSTVSLPAYVPQWQTMFGKADAAESVPASGHAAMATSRPR
jgi:hypothetical protein